MMPKREPLGAYPMESRIVNGTAIPGVAVVVDRSESEGGGGHTEEGRQSPRKRTKHRKTLLGREERLKKLTLRINSKRAGACVKVTEQDIASAFRGEYSLGVRCFATTLREITQEERDRWLEAGWVNDHERRIIEQLGV